MPRQSEATKLLLEGATPDADRPGPCRVRNADGSVSDGRPRRGRHRLAPRPEPDRERPRSPCARSTAGARRRAPASTIMTTSGGRPPSPCRPAESSSDFAAEAGRRAARNRRPGNRRANALPDGQRGREDPGRRRRPARVRYRCGVGPWLRLASSIAAARCTGPTAKGSAKIVEGLQAPGSVAWAAISASRSCCLRKPKRARSSGGNRQREARSAVAI